MLICTTIPNYTHNKHTKIHTPKRHDILYWWKTCSLYNKQKNTWVLGNTRLISRVEHDISDVQHSKYIWYFQAPMYFSVFDRNSQLNLIWNYTY